MNPNVSLLEQLMIQIGVLPVNLASGANNGDWVSLKNYQRMLIIFAKGAGAAGQDPTITLLQGKTSAGGTPIALTFTDIYSKVGTQTGIGTWTKTTQVAANTFVDTASAEAEALFAIEVLAEDLDIDNGYEFIQAAIADVGSTSQIGTILYIGGMPRYSGAPTDMLTMIA